ncbi:HAMP domain-containing protein [Paenibacillus sp. 19GGS1-52]|uniref:sensor histidine kinase n=1 Tax=Paenibacillus sp. 19GGS1-52 TaxID=2758563 RepID=UPI001EFB9EEC|nr:HAMP domain-containing sensor histidine kinase [Paenibacillus sp. 19GGS1-52]ULO04697.1 HAMP domain-containing protein [Paenibacillus sp. 19GGS1-52]
MSIRMKLLLSYAAMLIIPLILLIATSLLLAVVFRGDLQSLKSAHEMKFEGLEESDYHSLIKYTILNDPDLLTDKHFLDDISADMLNKNTYLYIRSGSDVLYSSDYILSQKELIAGLPSFKHAGIWSELKNKADGNVWYQIVQYDLSTKDLQPVSLFLLTEIDPLVHFARSFFPILFLSTLVILVLTHTLLTYFMSKRIIRPLLELRKAAQQVSEGNLDFQVRVSGKDEIGQLGMAFEEMRSRLQESIQMQLQYESNRKELITNISHDLKTPLTAIKGYVDGILEGVADSPEKSEKYMRTIATKAGEMDRLIDELFLYSKLDMQKLPFTFESVPIYAFLQDWAEELQMELEKQGVRLNLEIAIEEGIHVAVDRDSFKRVLSNVIQNSIKYMNKEQKRISLQSFAQNNKIILVIEDNGPGIPEAAVRHIFERFYRAEQSRNSYTGGSGLGLAIAKGIMLGHKGDIYAESVEGEGTRIYIVLPIEEEGSSQ